MNTNQQPQHAAGCRGYAAWQLQLGNCSLEIAAWKLQLGNAA